MTKIIYRYERKDIWGLSSDFAEDIRTSEKLRHVKIAFRCFKEVYALYDKTTGERINAE